ncbi:DUF2255 family protein [Agromyces sp. SYSU T00266]|uniref:DUF2255 family protein n=1 Tax=Agromyces zhanjiangensis TaxID=3158562 RepID=UPI0033970FC6
MHGWTDDQVDRVGAADQLEIASVRDDGSLRPFTTVWVVRVGDELFVRSGYGPENGWYRRAREAGVGRIKSAGIIRDVAFIDVPSDDAELHEALDAEYTRKYGPNHAAHVMATVLGDDVRGVTLRLDALD